MLGFADFYALTPPDNAISVEPGVDVEFPQDGPNSGTSIVRLGDGSFQLREPGTYLVWYQASVDQQGQLVLTLNGEELPATVSGRSTGTSAIAGLTLVTTVTANSVLTVRNPADNTAALTLTLSAGGAEANAAHLVILQLQAS